MEHIKPEWIDIPKHRPNFVKIKNSTIDNKGAFAIKNIKKGTFLGHYMGEIKENIQTGPYIFHSIRNNNMVAIDATNVDKSNWTRYMNCSTSKDNENVTSYFLNNRETYHINNQIQSLEGYIVFYANRDIKKGEELLYYYGDDYAKILGIKPT